MNDTPGDLRRTVQVVGTVVVGFTLVAHQGGGAFRTFLRERHNGSITGTLPGINTNNLGDDLATLFNYNTVTIVKPQELYLVTVMQRGAPDGCPGKLHRTKIGNGGDITRSPHLEIDREQLCDSLLCGIFVCYGPAGGFGSAPQKPLRFK